MPLPRRHVACLLGALLAVFLALPGASAQPALTAAISKVDSSHFPTVISYLTLVDGTGRPVLGLSPTDFAVLEDGKPVPSFALGTAVNLQEPLLVVLAIDTSGSMGGRAMDDAKAAASTFVQGLGAKDKGAVVSFAAQAAVAQPFTERKDELARAIGGLKAVGDTALYDSLVLAAHTVGQQTGGRRIIVLLSDGDDTASKATLDEAIAAVQVASAPVFTVGLGQNISRGILDTIASATGGVALYAPSSADLQNAYRNIADQLRNQYVLTLTSGLPPDGKRHSLLVRARAGGTQAEARANFIATWIPPEITVISPQAGQAVQGKVRVEVQVRSVAGIKRVDAIAAGRVIGSADKEPYVIEWDTSPLAAGNHTLDVAVHDVYGNRLTRQVTVRVEGGPPPTPLPTPTPSPTPTPAAPPQRNPLDDILLGSLGFFAATALALVLVRRARRPKAASAWQQMPKDLPISECPTCGRPLKRGRECPDCKAADDQLILRRLREIGGKDGEATPEQEEKK